MQEHNQVLLDKELLTRVLTYLSVRLFDMFRKTVYLVVHGGAVMVLHPSLSCRENTRDVDYNHRSFQLHWAKRGVQEASARLSQCIEETAKAYGLGADWMNAHADVALPMARGANGELIDPIYNDAMTPQNVELNTVFRSQGLVLIAVSWSWAVALKLIRYQKDDPNDIAAILKLGTQMRGCQWTVDLFEGWLNKLCSPMRYKDYPPSETYRNRMKMQDAIRRAQQLNWGSATTSYQPPPTLVHWGFQQAAPQKTTGLTRFPTPTEGMGEHQQVLNSHERLAATRSRTRPFPTSSSIHASSSSHSVRPSSSHSSSRVAMPTAPVPPVPVRTAASMPVTPAYYYYYNHPPQRQRHMSVSVPPQPAAQVIPAVPYVYNSQSTSRRSSPATHPPPPAPMPVHAAPPKRVEKLPPGFVVTHFAPRTHHSTVQRVAMVG